MFLDSGFAKKTLKFFTIPPKSKHSLSSFQSKRTLHTSNNYENIHSKFLNSPLKPVLRSKSQQNRQKRIQNCRKAMIASVETDLSSLMTKISPNSNMRASRSMDSIVVPTIISVQPVDSNPEDNSVFLTCLESSLQVSKSYSKKTSNGLPKNWTPRRKAPNSIANSLRQSKPLTKRSLFSNTASIKTSASINNNIGGFFSRRVASSWRRKKSAFTSRKSSQQNSQQNLHSVKMDIEGMRDYKTVNLKLKTSLGTADFTQSKKLGKNFF